MKSGDDIKIMINRITLRPIQAVTLGEGSQWQGTKTKTAQGPLFLDTYKDQATYLPLMYREV